MADVFISYASDDRERIQFLVPALENAGWSVFWDRTIPTGKSWSEFIDQELASCRALVIVWSEASVQSKWVEEEALEGKRRQILFPVRIDDVKPPFGFRTIQAIDMLGTDEAHLRAVCDQLVKDMSALLGPPPASLASQAETREAPTQAEPEAPNVTEPQTEASTQRDEPRPTSLWLPIVAVVAAVVIVVVVILVRIFGSDDPERVAQTKVEPKPLPSNPSEPEPEPIPTEPISKPKPSCPPRMVYIQGGAFDGGGGRREIDDFCMDLTEVTVGNYAGCVHTGHCTRPKEEFEKREDHPVTGIDRDQAKTFCEHENKRLPTEWEWEWAARGREEARPYPWGDESPSCANTVMYSKVDGHGCGQGGAWPAGAHPSDRSRDGVMDMGGNVAEWTASTRNGAPVFVGGQAWVARPFRVDARPTYQPPKGYAFMIGFRCVAVVD